jgi:hypothetical protein
LSTGGRSEIPQTAARDIAKSVQNPAEFSGQFAALFVPGAILDGDPA